MELPGFRFHPTEEELLDFYLKNMVTGKNPRFDIIDFLNIYHHDPWDLPGMAKVGEREWYFLVPRDRKHGNGGRPNRTTEKGFWKATGSDRKIVSMSDPKRLIGLRKTLVFYEGRAPRGSKTDWVMNEYRLPHTSHYPNKDNIVLCKIYRKATSLKVLEQRAAMEEPEQHEKNINPIIQMQIMGVSSSSSSPPHCSSSSNSSSNDAVSVMTTTHHLKTEKVEELLMDQTTPLHQEDDETILVNNKEMGITKMRKHENLGELEVPMKGMNMMMEYSNNYNTAQNMLQDPFWSQLNSPASWFQCFTPNPNYSNILNF